MSIWHKTIKDVLEILECDPLDSRSMNEAKELMKKIDLQDKDAYNQIWDDITEGSKSLQGFIQTVHHNCRSLIERGEWEQARSMCLEANRMAEKAKQKFARIKKQIVKL